MNKLKYKNISKFTKTFRGVEFRPGSVHEVSGYINDPGMLRVKDSTKVTATTSSVVSAEQSKRSTSKDTSKSEVKQNG